MQKHLESVNASGLLLALERGLIPLVHGDIALDRAVGGTIISTEAFFVQLVEIMPVTTIVLLGEVDGVLDQRGAVIDNITPATFADIAAALGESRGIDVTGGMLQKVSEMVALVQKYADLKIFIANGKRDGVLADLLVGGRQVGTLISAQE